MISPSFESLIEFFFSLKHFSILFITLSICFKSNLRPALPPPPTNQHLLFCRLPHPHLAVGPLALHVVSAASSVQLAPRLVQLRRRRVPFRHRFRPWSQLCSIRCGAPTRQLCSGPTRCAGLFRGTLGRISGRLGRNRFGPTACLLCNSGSFGGLLRGNIGPTFGLLRPTGGLGTTAGLLRLGGPIAELLSGAWLLSADGLLCGVGLLLRLHHFDMTADKFEFIYA